MSKWRPISEAPRDGTRILVYQPAVLYKGGMSYPPYIEVAEYRDYDGKWDAGDVILDPTHWMPRPRPPESDVVLSSAWGPSDGGPLIEEWSQTAIAVPVITKVKAKRDHDPSDAGAD